MKAIISLIGAAFLLGTTGCQDTRYSGGAYNEYPSAHYGHYRHYDGPAYGSVYYGPYYGRSYGRYSRSYGYYDTGRYYPSVGDDYWSRNPYR